MRRMIYCVFCLKAGVWLLGKGDGGCFAIAFPAVGAGICNLLVVPVIAHLLYAKDTVGYYNIHQLMLADGDTWLYVHLRDGTQIDESPCQ